MRDRKDVLKLDPSSEEVLAYFIRQKMLSSAIAARAVEIFNARERVGKTRIRPNKKHMSIFTEGIIDGSFMDHGRMPRFSEIAVIYERDVPIWKVYARYKIEGIRILKKEMSEAIPDDKLERLEEIAKNDQEWDEKFPSISSPQPADESQYSTDQELIELQAKALAIKGKYVHFSFSTHNMPMQYVKALSDSLNNESSDDEAVFPPRAFSSPDPEQSHAIESNKDKRHSPRLYQPAMKKDDKLSQSTEDHENLLATGSTMGV